MFMTPPDTQGPTVTLDEPDDVDLTGCWSDFSYSTATMGKLFFTVSDDCGSATASYTTSDDYSYCAEADDANPEGGLVITRTFTLTAEDCYGNQTVESVTQTITVTDNLGPAFTSTLPNDTTVDCTTVPAALTLTASDSCDTDVSISVNDATTPGSCAGSYTLTRTYTAVDDCGNETSHVQTITVQDTTAPVATAQDITVQLDASGNASITGAQLDNGSTDNCGSLTFSVDITSFDCTNIGANTVVFTAQDDCGLSSTASATVTVEDNVNPTAIAQDIVVQLDATGSASITGAQIDNGSNDACGIQTTTVAPDSFNCSNVGANTVTITVTDNNNNVSTATATVTIEDNINPTAICQDLTVQLDASGAGSITASQVNNGSFDNCVITTLALDKMNFTCADVGANTVTMTVTDINGNTGTCTSTVTVQDNVAPIAICQDLTVQLDASGAGSITAAQVNNGSSDNCSIDTMTLDQTDFTCADIGTKTVTLTVTDVNGNTSTCTSTITVEDNVAPIALCQNLTVQLDATGAGSITAAQVDNGSSDNCSIDTMTLDQTDFTCADVGANTVTMTVTDANGNVSTCTSTITVQDNINPTAICQDLTVQLDASGAGSITASQVNNGSFDNCVITTLALDKMNFTCADVGANTVTMTVTDINGNTGTCTSTVTVQDNVAPIAICQDLTVQLDASGAGSITAAQVNNGSSDNCSIDTMTLDQTDFTCADIGTKTVTLTVTDVNGNTSTCTSTITVEDNVAPIALCQNLTVQLDATGAGSITAAQVDNGSSDNCSIDTMTLDQTDFTCADVGANTVTMTVTDANGNVSTCTSTITVQDNINPTAICQDLTVQLDASGAGSITASQVNNGSFDNCVITTLALDKMNFTCADVGANTVTMTVTDINGNTGTCTSTVTVQDNVAPIAICQDLTVQLDASGAGSITAAQVNNGSSDNCSIDTMTLDQTDFTCADIGTKTVTLTVTDVNGNTSTCTSTITVEDNVAPIALCQNLTVQLDATGAGSITAAQVDNGSSDNCSIDTMTLDQTDFTCADVGANTVTMTVTDANGNVSTCTSTITVQDNINPTAICQDLTVQLDASGAGSITASQVNNGSFDNCVITTLALDKMNFTCADVGANTVTMTVTDINGNTGTCTSTVTVQDNVAPIAICQDLTVQLDASGAGSITAAQVNNGSSDNCSIDTMTLDQTDFGLRRYRHQDRHPDGDGCERQHEHVYFYDHG